LAKVTKTYPKVSVVVVNYNGKHLLKDCLGSLFALDYPGDALEIIMVDNVSSDGSSHFVRKNYPSVKILNNASNNYCQALNLGIKSSVGDFVVTLNNDTWVKKDWLLELVKVAILNKDIAGVGSKILFEDGRINSVGHKMLPNYYWSDLGFKEDDQGQFDNITEVESICGASSLYRKSCLEDVGLFDEDFQMYLEDVDINLRLRNKGYKIYFSPKSIVYHRYHGTAQEEFTVFQIEKNRLLFLAKHYPEKLAGALLGSGYFTALQTLNRQRDIYNILPLVLAKLYRHHQSSFVFYLNEIWENLKSISNLEKDKIIQLLEEEKKQMQHMQQRFLIVNDELNRKEIEIKEKNSELDTLNQELQARLDTLRLKDELLKQKDLLLSEKEASFESLREELRGVKNELEKLALSLKEKDSYLQDKESELKTLNQELQARLDTLRLKDELLKQKDLLIAEKDAHLKKLAEALTATQQEIKNKELGLYQNRQLVEEKNAQIADLNSKLLLRFEELQRVKEELEKTTLNLRELENLLGQKNSDINRLNQEKEAFYSSQTFIFVVRPLWNFLDFLKGIKKRLIKTLPFTKKEYSTKLKNNKVNYFAKGLESKSKYRNKRRGLFLSFLWTNSARAYYGKNNQYFVKITNVSSATLKAKLIIDIYRDSGYPYSFYSSFEKEIEINSSSALELAIEYDWKNNVFFKNGKDVFLPDRFSFNTCQSSQGRYAIQANLVDHNRKILDSLTIYQSF